MLLIDNSAWSRVVAGKLPHDTAGAIADRIERRELATCLPFLLEAGYSAPSARDRREMMADFASSFPRVELTAVAGERALRAQGELAIRGHHRLSPIDLLIAACAHEVGAGVLHYDRDYDVIAELTSLRFESVWVAPAGTL
ncbi:MAG TPA: PIN domain-containing protein [Solirubrobacterales bacterium]|nr:PIN domain-containing protein [Solirubrobacterales bacterium]